MRPSIESYPVYLLMLDLKSDPALQFLFRIARRRVVTGFIVAAIVFYFARPTWWSILLGVPIAILGESIRLWAAGHLIKGQEVTTSGPYAFVRHPLYMGSALLGLGFVVAAASLLVAVIVLGYLSLMISVAIRLEEATLRADFGETHARYVAGKSPAGARRFSVRRVRENREHQSLLGLLVSVAVLCLLAA